MSNKRIYLKNGCEAILHENLSENRFVIEKLLQYKYDGEISIEPSGVQEIVTEIFTTAPAESIELRIKSLTEQQDAITKEVQELNSEKQKLRNEVYRLNEDSKKIDNWVIDLRKWRNAKNIIIFSPNAIAPHILSYQGKGEENIHSISFELKIGEAKLNKWYSYSGNSSNFIDDKHEIYFDLSDEEIIKVTNERSENLDLSNISSYGSNVIAEKYQTPKVKKWLKERKDKANADRVVVLNQQIENLQKELKELNNG